MSEEILLQDVENDIAENTVETPLEDTPCEEKSFTKESSTEVPNENDIPLPSEMEEAPANERELTAEEMLKELKALREELLEKRKVFEKMSRDISEFEEIYPDKKVNEIPDSVWESVKSGIPLAAAYALYERKNAFRADVAKSINVANSSLSTGSIGREVTENFYTPDEVRAMSRAEVKRNYSKIIESMKKWN